jgi:hypothetical protein
MKYFIISFLLCVSFKSGCQQLSGSSKSPYNLFHPTPKNLMRDLETDRPDATESPITLDAGHFQCETDLFKTERSNFDGIKTTTNFYNAANIKTGITNSLDLQIIAESFTTTTIISNPGGTAKQTGFGMLTVRAKQNLWGNDGGKSAFAILPFINVPVHASDKFSGGIVFPFATQLGKGWNFGTQIETDLASSRNSTNHHIDYSISATGSHSFIKNLDFFIEGLALRNNEIKSFEYFLNGGLVYNLEKNINIDTGIYYGIKHISPKTFFVGLSFRI